MATIGIRGTGYLIKLDDSGLIITVNLGSIAAINDGGTVILVNGQTGIIVDAQTAAQLVDQKPEVGPAPPSDVSDDPATDQSQQDDDNILAGFTDEAEDFTEMMIEEDEIIDQVFQLESGPGFAVAGTGPVFFDPVKRGISVSPFPTAVDQPLDAVFEDGVLVSFNGSAKGDLEAVGGSNESIGWVRWFNSTNGLAEFTIDGQLQTFTLQNQSVHGLAGKTISDGEMAMLSIDKPQVVFDTLAWTTPTSLLGELGSFDGATLELDLVKGLVAGTLDFSMFGFNYRMALNSLPSATGRSVRRPPRFLGGLVPTALAAVTAAPEMRAASSRPARHMPGLLGRPWTRESTLIPAAWTGSSSAPRRSLIPRPVNEYRSLHNGFARAGSGARWYAPRAPIYTQDPSAGPLRLRRRDMLR